MKRDDIIREIDRLSRKIALNFTYGPISLADRIVGVQPMNIPGYPKTTIALKKLMPKYQFSRARWYQAEFKPDDYHAVDAWCSQQFGPHPARPDAWSRWWHKFEYSILFRDKEDYIMFKLRWGE
jgi:hypothetical protein